MGILIGIANDGTEAANAYGVRKDLSNSGSELTRIHKGNPSLHATLPWHSNWKQCILSDSTGEVLYYLDPTDRTKKLGGGAAVLDGSDGQVMVEVPESWWKVEHDSDGYSVLVSAVSIPGYTYAPKFYVGSFEATIDRTAGQLLSAIPPQTSQYRGSDNTSGYDGTDRDLRGLPVGNLSLNDYRTAARQVRWDAWNIMTFWQWSYIYWAYCIEYANQNCQLPFNAALTPEGFKQGGLGPGASIIPYANHSAWNGQRAFLRPGITNSLGNATGVVAYNMPASYAATYGATVVEVPSYRGIENIFGHMPKFLDAMFVMSYDDRQELFLCIDRHRAGFDDEAYYYHAANLPNMSGYGMKPLFLDVPTFLPETLGGSSSTYMCDTYVMSTASSVGQKRSVWVTDQYGLGSGIASVETTFAYTYAYRSIGARLSGIVSY